MENKKVLYGDDNAQMRNSLARALKLRNWDLDLVSSPQEVVAKARANPYDAVVTDLQYSPDGQEGYEVLKQIRELPVLKVIYSAQCGFEAEAEALDSGADYAVLRKDESGLMAILDEKLGDKNGK